MRQSFRGLVHSVRRYGICTRKEAWSVFITSVVFGFILSFRMWGDTFDPWLGVYNWTMFSIFSALGILSMMFGQKVMAYEMGYFVDYTHWKVGLTVNTFICFITNGFAVFLTMGGFHVRRNEGTQIGKNNWGILYLERAFIVFWGFFSLVLYTVLVKMIFPEGLAQPMTTTAYIIALWSLAPIDIVFKFFFREAPNSNGTCLFASRKLAFSLFTLVFLGISALTNYYFTAFWPVLLALILATVAYVVFYVFLDPTKRLYKY